jgi:RNase P subunit RPR2
MPEEEKPNVDNTRASIRGRICPRCGGKIVPSLRAVYESKDPAEIFPVWQCERCGYEELGAKQPAAKKAVAHGANPKGELPPGGKE